MQKVKVESGAERHIRQGRERASKGPSGLSKQRERAGQSQTIAGLSAEKGEKREIRKKGDRSG